jgi:hypothetical protein
MVVKKTVLSALLLFLNLSIAQTKYYRIDITDGSNSLFTMNQFSSLVLNGYRFGFGEIDYSKLNKKEDLLVNTSQLFLSGIILMPLTHEEGHRSILTELNIGSISSPFIDSKGVAKVTGVTDETLQNLRDSKLPAYIRLHNGGLESDYDYLKKEDALFNFGEENYNVLYNDYFIRKIAESMYYFTNFLHSKTGLKEADTPELNRDIVGHDIFGMIRHLHRPTMTFSRYTEWNDLTGEEKSYGRRIGFLSFLNYCNPNIWKRNSYKLSNNIKGNFSLNYSLAPFGDFTEQNVYLNINNKWKINPFLREYFNKTRVFWSSGINLHNFVFNKNFITNSSIEVWQQPKDLSFNTSYSEFGFGLKTELAYNVLKVKNSNIFFNTGLSYKTKGFVPAAPSLNEDFRLNFGLIIETIE